MAGIDHLPKPSIGDLARQEIDIMRRVRKAAGGNPESLAKLSEFHENISGKMNMGDISAAQGLVKEFEAFATSLEGAQPLADTDFERMLARADIDRASGNEIGVRAALAEAVAKGNPEQKKKAEQFIATGQSPHLSAAEESLRAAAAQSPSEPTPGRVNLSQGEALRRIEAARRQQAVADATDAEVVLPAPAPTLSGPELEAKRKQNAADLEAELERAVNATPLPPPTISKSVLEAKRKQNAQDLGNELEQAANKAAAERFNRMVEAQGENGEGEDKKGGRNASRGASAPVPPPPRLDLSEVDSMGPALKDRVSAPAKPEIPRRGKDFLSQDEMDALFNGMTRDADSANAGAPEAKNLPAEKTYNLEPLKVVFDEELEKVAHVKSISIARETNFDKSSNVFLHATLEAESGSKKEIVSVEGKVEERDGVMVVTGIKVESEPGIEASPALASQIKNRLSDVGDALRLHFAQEENRSISSVHLTPDGSLKVEFESPGQVDDWAAAMAAEQEAEARVRAASPTAPLPAEPPATQTAAKKRDSENDMLWDATKKQVRESWRPQTPGTLMQRVAYSFLSDEQRAKVQQDVDRRRQEAEHAAQIPSPALPQGVPEDLSPAEKDHWYEVQGKFDLAKAYEEMGDRDGAKDILQEALKEGDGGQQFTAKQELIRLGTPAEDVEAVLLKEAQRRAAVSGVGPAPIPPMDNLPPLKMGSPEDSAHDRYLETLAHVPDLREHFRSELQTLYDASDGTHGDIPDDVWKHFLALTDDHGRRLRAGDIEGAKTSAAAVEDFMNRERIRNELRDREENAQVDGQDKFRVTHVNGVPVDPSGKVEPGMGTFSPLEQEEVVAKERTVGENKRGFRKVMEEVRKTFGAMEQGLPEVMGGLGREAAGGMARLRTRGAELGGKLRDLFPRSEKLRSGAEYLKTRAKELDTESLKRFGAGAEAWLKRRGEAYNKAPLWQKVVLGASLATGAALTGGIPAYAYGAAIAFQRVQGMAGMYAKLDTYFQKTFSNVREWERKVAAGSWAALYSVAMSGAIGLAIEYAKELEVDVGIQNWLRDHWPFKGAETTAPAAAPPAPEKAPAAPPSSEPAPRPTTETPSAKAAAPETSARASAIENTTKPSSGATPEPSRGAAVSAETSAEIRPINAAPGKGYEWMAQKFWEQLQGKELNAGAYPEGSDMRRLLEADATSYKEVIHEIAKERGLFNEDGSTRMKVSLTAKMMLGADGNLSVDGMTERVTPPQVAVRPPTDEVRAMFSDRETSVPQGAAPPSLNVLEQTQSNARPPSAQVREFFDRRFAGEAPPIPSDMPGNITLPGESSGSAMPETPSQSAPSAPSESPQTPSEPAASNATTQFVPERASATVVNGRGLTIELNKAHLYEDANGRPMLFGGTPETQRNILLDFFADRGNLNKSLFGPSADNRHLVEWKLIDGVVRPEPVYTRGFLGIRYTLTPAATAEALQKLIK